MPTLQQINNPEEKNVPQSFALIKEGANAGIYTTNKITALLEILKDKCAKKTDWVFSDFDLTLTECSKQIPLCEVLAKEVRTPLIDKLKKEDASLISSAYASQTPVLLEGNDTLRVFEEISTNFYSSILTVRRTGIPEGKNTTTEEEFQADVKEKLKLKFSSPFDKDMVLVVDGPDIANPNLRKYKTEGKPGLYGNAIFSNNKTKGYTLKAVLDEAKALNKLPTKIFMIDDKIEDLESIRSICGPAYPGIEFVCVHYTKKISYKENLEKEIQALSPNQTLVVIYERIVDLTVIFLKNNCKLLANEELFELYKQKYPSILQASLLDSFSDVFKPGTLKPEGLNDSGVVNQQARPQQPSLHN